jgi:hypothetical protein
MSNFLPARKALEDFQILLSRYDTNSPTDDAEATLDNALDIIEPGLQSVSQSDEPMRDVRRHVRRMHLAATENELEDAEAERQAALAACQRLHNLIEEFVP